MNVEKTVITTIPLVDLRDLFRSWIDAALKAHEPQQPRKEADPLNDFVEKKEVRGKLASAATLWKMEKAGKIKSYGFGGKRYYKRSELLAAFEVVKEKEVSHE